MWTQKRLCEQCAEEKDGELVPMPKSQYACLCECCEERPAVGVFKVHSPLPLTLEDTDIPDGMVSTVELDVDPRTTVNMNRLAERWECDPGEVVDSIMIHFLRGSKRKKNGGHHGRKV